MNTSEGQTQEPVGGMKSPQKFLKTFEGFDFDEAFTDHELEQITNAMSAYHKYASQKVKNDTELFRDDFQAYADRILRDKGASNKDVFDAINDTIQELSKKYNITILASLPSSSVTGEEDWKFKFSEWLINNRGLPPIVVDIIVAHVERYIVKSIPVTGEWQLCPKCNGEGFLQIGKAIPDGRIDFTCEVCNGKKILAKPGESEAIGFAEWMGKGFEMIIDGSWECFSEEYCEKYNLQLDEHYTTSELLSTYKQSKK